MLLCEDPQQEVSISVRLKGGGDDDVLPGGQPELAAHLPGVDEDFRKTVVLVLGEKVLLQVHIVDILKLHMPCRWAIGPAQGRWETG